MVAESFVKRLRSTTRECIVSRRNVNSQLRRLAAIVIHDVRTTVRAYALRFLVRLARWIGGLAFTRVDAYLLLKACVELGQNSQQDVIVARAVEEGILFTCWMARQNHVKEAFIDELILCCKQKISPVVLVEVCWTCVPCNYVSLDKNVSVETKRASLAALAIERWRQHTDTERYLTPKVLRQLVSICRFTQPERASIHGAIVSVLARAIATENIPEKNRLTASLCTLSGFSTSATIDHASIILEEIDRCLNQDMEIPACRLVSCLLRSGDLSTAWLLLDVLKTRSEHPASKLALGLFTRYTLDQGEKELASTSLYILIESTAQIVPLGKLEVLCGKVFS